MSNEDNWTSRLVSEIDDRSVPQWVRDAIARGYPKSIVMTAFVKYDREVSARVAYG